MTAFFEWLFKYRPLLFERGDISFHPLWSPYLFPVFVLAAIAVACWLYRRTRYVLPVSWRYGLASLRAAAFLVVLFLLAQPVLRLRSAVPQENFVAVACDWSRSMEIRDGAGGQSRMQVAQRMLQPQDSPLIKELSAKFKLRFFRFSKNAERVEAFDGAFRRGGSTDLGRSLEQIAGELSSVPLAGVVLISDGADNRSANLDKTADLLRARGVPVYAIGIGSPRFSRDSEILRVSTPGKVLKGTTVEADVSVVSTGYSGRRSRLEVFDGGRQVQSREIELGGDGEVKNYKVSFSGQTVGPGNYRFRLTPFPDDVVPENNEQGAFIEVEDEKPQVLYVEGEPRWEYAFIRRAMLEDKNLRLVALLRQANGKFLGQGESESASIMEKGFPTGKPELFRFKAIILGSVEASFFTFDQLRMISDFVSQRGGGFLMLGGKNSFGEGGYRNTPVEELLPLNIREASGFKELEFKARPTSYGFLHPALRLSSSEEQNRKRWDSAPALSGFNPTFGLKPGATLLAKSGATDSRGESADILAFQRYGKGKSMALAAADTWRWKMGLDHADNMHPLFWKQMLRWLVSDAPGAVSASTDKPSYSRDDSVTVRVEANDDSFLPVNDAQAVARIRAPSGEIRAVQLAWDVEKDGAYSASFEPPEEGVHEIFAEAAQGAKPLGAAKAYFQVAESAEEFHDAALNAEGLKRLSEATGGRWYSPDDAGALAEDISYTDSGVFRMEEKDLWDMPFLFLLLVGFISAEWILRKRKGLP